MRRTSSVPRAGDRVEVLAGRLRGVTGTVTWVGVDGSCGCRSVFVATEAGEFFGKVSEVRRA
jgi:ribosomal protein L24